MHLPHRLFLCVIVSLLIGLCGEGIATAPPARTEPPPPIPAFAPEREPRLPTRGAVRQQPAPQAVAQAPIIRELRPSEPPEQVPILLYHDLAPGARGGNGTTVDVAEFAWQMAWLAENGYTPVTTAELLDWLQGKGQLPPRPIQIHFDDGYLSNHALAMPLMKKHDLRGILFLVSAFPGDPGLQGMLSWEQIRAMQGTFEIQGHTHAGHDRTGGVPNLVAWSDRQIREDIGAMVQRFTAAGLPAPTAFTYPYGAYDDETVAALRSQGVTLAFTVEHGYVRRKDDPYRLKRLIVWPGLSVCQFAVLVSGESGCQ